MASRAVLIGLAGDNKLFYLLDDREDGKNLGIVNANGSINYVDLISFIMKHPKINEFKFSDFHRFIWDPQDGDEQDRWERIFVNKTQRVTKDMLVGTSIANNFGTRPNKNAIQAKADLFRRIIRTSGSTDIHPLYLSRKSISPMRAIIGFKNLGASISIQPSVDGDGDGFIDDGLPTMRPFVAGFDIDLSPMGMIAQGNNSDILSSARDVYRSGGKMPEKLPVPADWFASDVAREQVGRNFPNFHLRWDSKSNLYIPATGLLKNDASSYDAFEDRQLASGYLNRKYWHPAIVPSDSTLAQIMRRWRSDFSESRALTRALSNLPVAKNFDSDQFRRDVEVLRSGLNDAPQLGLGTFRVARLTPDIGESANIGDELNFAAASVAFSADDAQSFELDELSGLSNAPSKLMFEFPPNTTGLIFDDAGEKARNREFAQGGDKRPVEGIVSGKFRVARIEKREVYDPLKRKKVKRNVHILESTDSRLRQIGSRSIQTQPSNSVEDRKRSSQYIISTIDEVVLAASTQFHDGKPIKTKRDAIRALTRAIPSFGNKSGSDKSRIDFLDKISNDNDELQPWHIEYISQFLIMVGNHPQRNSLMYEIKEIDRRQPPQYGGNTGPGYASRGWVPDPNGSGRYIPVDLRKGKLVVTYRSPDSAWERLKLISMPISKPDKKNFNILSSSVDENVRSEMLDLVNTGKVPAMFYGYYRLLTQTSDQVRTYQDLLASGKQLHSVELESIANFIISARRAILEIETDIPGIKTQRLPLSPLDEYSLITANPGVLMRALAELDNLSADVLVDSTMDKYKNLVDPILDKWGSVDTTITGVHEATHVLQMISINARNEKRANQFRQQFIADQTQKRMNEIRQTMGDAAARQQFARIRKEAELMAPPMESFLIDVLKDEIKSFALSDPELFKFRLLTYGMDQGILPNIQQGDGLDVFMPFISHWLSMYVNGSVSTLAPNMDDFFSQSFELDGQKILITPDISRLLKESIGPNIANLPKFGSMDAGQPLTMGHITFMYQIMMDGEKLSHTLFRNINSETIKLNPATTTRELGIPDIEDGQRLIRGLTPEESQPFVQAWIAAMPAIDRVMKKAKQGDVIAMLDSRQRPDRVVLPPEFGGLKYSELMALKPEQLADLAEKAIDGLVQRSIDLDRRSPQRRASFILDLPRYYVGEFGPLTQAEIKQLVQISGKIGLPTGRAKDPAYSSYQAALLLNKMQLSPNAFMLFEFAAETGVAELFKIALSQVNISGIDTRSLTNDELQLLNKFFAFIYQAGFPSDIVGRVNG